MNKPRPSHNVKQAAAPATRELLLQAASEVMIENDAFDFSLRQLEEKAKISSTLVKYYFGDKERMFIALMERDVQRAVRELQHLAEMNIDAKRMLKIHISALINANFRAPYVSRLVNNLLRTGTEESKSWIRTELILPIVEFQDKLLKQGFREAIFIKFEPMYFYFLVVGACENIFSARSSLSDIFGVKEISDAIRTEYAEALFGVIYRSLSFCAELADRRHHRRIAHDEAAPWIWKKPGRTIFGPGGVNT